MSSAFSEFFGNFSKEYEIFYEEKELPTVHWPLSKHPFIVFMIFVSYILLATKIGPFFMKNRKPFVLTKFLLVYNFLQVLISVWLVYLNSHGFGSTFLYENRYRVIFQQPFYLTNGGWWYFLAKVLELTDTAIMVLRKKQSQVTFLHLYHHSSMVIVSWVFMRYFPCDNLVLVCLYNSVVHVVMYTYYFLAGFGPKMQRYLWWKKYITLLQLVQFSMGFYGVIATLIYDDEAHKAPLYLQLILVVIFLCLFGKFYFKTYIGSIKTGKPSPTTKPQSKTN